MQVSRDGEWRDDVEQYAQSLVDARLVPGMSIAVTQGDPVVYSRVFELADAASGRRADDRTAFYIARKAPLPHRCWITPPSTRTAGSDAWTGA